MNWMIAAIRIILMRRSVSSRRHVLLLPAILFIHISIAQFSIVNNAQNKYRAVHWGPAEGLSHAEVYHIIKDINGFLWVGTTNGLNRFDGNKFKIFFHDPENSSTIGGNTILGFVEDSVNNIWIGTDKGLSRYDIKADSFTNFILTPQNGTCNLSQIRPLCATRDEVYCLETGINTITSYNVHSLKKKTLLKLASSDGLLSASGSHFDPATNSIWLLSGRGTETEVLQIEMQQGQKRRYRWPCTRKNNIHDHQSSALCYDNKRNSLWINTPDGLMQFTLTDMQFKRVEALNDWVTMKDYGSLAGIDCDKEGKVWLSTLPAGILVYDPTNGSVTLPFENQPDLQKDVSTELVALYIDRQNIVWTGYWSRKGLYQTVAQEPALTRYAVNSAKPFTHLVGNFINGENGNLWISYSEGLLVFDSHSNLFKVLHEKDLPGIRGKEFLPIAMDANQRKAWLLAHSESTNSPFGNLYEMDVKTKKCQPVIFKNGSGHTLPLSELFIIPTLMEFNITPFRNGCVVVAVHNKQQSFFLVTDEKPIANQIFSFPEFTFTPFIGTDGDQFIFLKSMADGLNASFIEKDGQWTKTPTPLDSIKWQRIAYNKSDHSYWLIAFQQLLHYDKNFKLIKKYTVKDGIPELQIYSLGPDNRGNIWFNTDRSIYQLNIETGNISMLSEKDGFLPQNFSPGEELRITDNKGNIYFPAGFYGKGFDRVSPDNFVSPPSFVYVQSIEINQQPSTLHRSSNNISRLSLRHSENTISIETGIIDYYSKGKSRIRYKLEGLDTSWHYGLHYHHVSYERIPPGKYKLVMQASNAANEFNGPAKILSIDISPSFWTTWWFKISASILLISLIYIVTRLSIRQKFKRQMQSLEKERQVMELRQKTTELEMQALRAQMNPHFIFNSLNSINRFIMQSDKAQASRYLTKFSRLVRLILQNSQASLITLESELESLELYLTLEGLRFNHHFDYKISVATNIDASSIKLPPLILQPYIENAIWHGLMHKEDKGQLDIEISKENNQLYIKITDNGVGRENASLLTSKSATKYKSMGLSITANRIASLQHLQNIESVVTINDLVNGNGSAAGTEVIIKIPAIHD